MNGYIVNMLLELCAILSFQPHDFDTDSFALKPPLPPCILRRYDWGANIVLPPDVGPRALDHTVACGGQVGEFCTNDLDYRYNPQSVKFVENFMPNAVPMRSDMHTLLYGALVALANFPDGIAIDLGAGSFRSSNLIGSVFARNLVFACDTFTGLPSEWVRGGSKLPTGTFGPRRRTEMSQPPFPLLDNVVAVKGTFSETIPQILPLMSEHPLALVHVDSGSYRSAVDGLKPLLPLLRVGTVLVFGEFYNYSGFEDGEFLAFKELIIDGGFECSPLAFNAHHQQVVIQITGVPDDQRLMQSDGD
ncbi:MAG: class I SAM-dependent methyltransferase [Puniceicoccales bacterium]|nr:class I SAM-dependent methyltransferase [Puniceicoccales bacterium]